MELDLKDLEKRLEKAFYLLFLVRFYCEAKFDQEDFTRIIPAICVVYYELDKIYDTLLCHNSGWDVD